MANFVGRGTVQVVASPADGGTVTGGGTADTNKMLKLTAKAKPNWKFQGWADGGSAAASRTVRVAQGGVTYTALFGMVTGDLVLSANHLAFGTVPVGQVATQQVTLTNVGTNSVKVSSLRLPAGFTARPATFTLPVTGATNILLLYEPTKVGATSGTVTFVSNAARGPTNLIVTGKAIAATRIIRLSGPLDFGQVLANATSNLTLTVDNLGNAPMVVTAMSFTYTKGRATFSLPGWKPFTVAAGGTTNLTVCFKPIKTGTNVATLTATVTSMTTGVSTNTLRATGTCVEYDPARQLDRLPIPSVVVAPHVLPAGTALVVRVVALTGPAAINQEVAAVVVAGGKAQVVPAWQVGDGATCTITTECQGPDLDADGIPDALATALGDYWQEGAKLLTIQIVDGVLTATTPFTEWLVVAGGPVRQEAWPVTWQLVPVVP
jgi:hypothetical protein